MIHRERLIRSERVFTGKVINVRVDTVELPNGLHATRDVVEHRGAVTIIPMPDTETVIMVRQYRHPVGEILLELPAGALGKGEDPEDCARREAAEETGFRPGKLEKLLEFYVAPGYCEEILHIYLASDLIPESAAGDEDEFIEVVNLPLSEALRKLDSGEIKDAKTIIGLLVVAGRMAS